jgi:hypothetical protein
MTQHYYETLVYYLTGIYSLLLNNVKNVSISKTNTIEHGLVV